MTHLGDVGDKQVLVSRILDEAGLGRWGRNRVDREAFGLVQHLRQGEQGREYVKIGQLGQLGFSQPIEQRVGEFPRGREGPALGQASRLVIERDAFLVGDACEPSRRVLVGAEDSICHDKRHADEEERTDQDDEEDEEAESEIGGEQVEVGIGLLRRHGAMLARGQ